GPKRIASGRWQRRFGLAFASLANRGDARDNVDLSRLRFLHIRRRLGEFERDVAGVSQHAPRGNFWLEHPRIARSLDRDCGRTIPSLYAVWALHLYRRGQSWRSNLRWR